MSFGKTYIEIKDTTEVQKTDIPINLLLIMRMKYPNDFMYGVIFYQFIKVVGKYFQYSKDKKEPLSNELLQKLMGISRRKFMMAKKILVELGVLELIQTRKKQGQYSLCQYKIRHFDDSFLPSGATRTGSSARRDKNGDVNQVNSNTGNVNDSHPGSYQNWYYRGSKNLNIFGELSQVKSNNRNSDIGENLADSEKICAYIYNIILFFSSFFYSKNEIKNSNLNDGDCLHVNNSNSKQKAKESSKKEDEGYIRFWPVQFQSDQEFVHAWNEWCAHRRNSRAKLSSKSAQLMAKNFSKHKVADVIEAIEFSIMQGYRGLFAPNQNQNKKKDDLYSYGRSETDGMTSEEFIQYSLEESKQLNTCKTIIDSDLRERIRIERGEIKWRKPFGEE